MTKQNAASAEESASAAEEMNTMAAHMNGYVRELVLLVAGGNGRNGNENGSHIARLAFQPETPFQPARATGKKVSPEDMPGREIIISNSREVSSEAIIPLDGDF